MHRDLKPENILCEENADDPNDNRIWIKLTDFGFATRYDPDRPQTISLGSPHYMAPEIVRQIAYDNKVDVWAVGVITFFLMSGKFPFNNDINHGPRQKAIQEAIKNKEPNYDDL